MTNYVGSMKTTPTTRLASLLLGQDLGEWLTTQRDRGLSWQEVADALTEATRGEVVVSDEWLRLLHRDAA